MASTGAAAGARGLRRARILEHLLLDLLGRRHAALDGAGVLFVDVEVLDPLLVVPVLG
jgi:hypothetical protein